MGYEYDPLRPMNYLQYLDANNLYGWAMSQALPTGEFRWIDVKQEDPKELIEKLVNQSGNMVIC